MRAMTVTNESPDGRSVYQSALKSQRCRREERLRGQFLVRFRTQTEVSTHSARYISRKY